MAAEVVLIVGIAIFRLGEGSGTQPQLQARTGAHAITILTVGNRTGGIGIGELEARVSVACQHIELGALAHIGSETSNKTQVPSGLGTKAVTQFKNIADAFLGRAVVDAAFYANEHIRTDRQIIFGRRLPMTRLDEFKKALEEFGAVSSLAITGSVLAPILSAASGLAPPWPNNLEFVTVTMMLLTLAMVFQFLPKRRSAYVKVFVTGTAMLVVALAAQVYKRPLQFHHPDNASDWLSTSPV